MLGVRLSCGNISHKYAKQSGAKFHTSSTAAQIATHQTGALLLEALEHLLLLPCQLLQFPLKSLEATSWTQKCLYPLPFLHALQMFYLNRKK